MVLCHVLNDTLIAEDYNSHNENNYASATSLAVTRLLDKVFEFLVLATLV